MSTFPFFLRRVLRRDDVRRARIEHAEALRRASAAGNAEALRFEAATRCNRGNGRVILGRARSVHGEPYWVGVDPKTLLSTHLWVTGASGSGKTYFLIALILQYFGLGVSQLLLDMKSELTNLLLPILPRERVRIIRPFGAEGAELRITEPEPGVPPEIQALNIASALEEGLGEALGLRMTLPLLVGAKLLIELREPLTALRDWLASPAAFARAAQRSTDAEIREYVRNRFPRENKASVLAALARLESFLFLPDVRRAVTATRCTPLCDFQPGIVVIVDLGSPQAGAERAQRFWAGALTGRIIRSILSRAAAEVSKLSALFLEEVQESMGSRQAVQLGRGLSLMRHKGCSITVSHQDASQIGSIDPTLVKLLRTNVGCEVAFRAGRDDARLIAEAMPIPSDAGSMAEAKSGLVRELMQLERRECVLWLRMLGLAPQRIRSPRLELAALETGHEPEAEPVLDMAGPAEPAANSEAPAAGPNLFSLLDDDDDPHPRLG